MYQYTLRPKQYYLQKSKLQPTITHRIVIYIREYGFNGINKMIYISTWMSIYTSYYKHIISTVQIYPYILYKTVCMINFFRNLNIGTALLCDPATYFSSSYVIRLFPR